MRTQALIIGLAIAGCGSAQVAAQEPKPGKKSGKGAAKDGKSSAPKGPTETSSQDATASAAKGAEAATERPRDKDLEKRVAELERRLRELEPGGAATGKPQAPDAGKDPEPEGMITLGGAKLFFGGKAEILFIDAEAERSPILGDTDNPDPHFELERLRLEPRLEIHRDITLRGQIDFKPEAGSTILKELALEHEALPLEWLETDFRLGLQDRFFRPSRPTKNYPLPGNAFWRDETMSAILRLGFGDPRGAAASDGTAGAGPSFLKSLGQARLFLSASNGPVLDTNEIGSDRAAFNDLVQDDRAVDGDLGLREIGVGLGYVREMETFGEIEALVFFIDDELKEESVEFLQQELTVRDPITGAPVAGYGDSDSRRSRRWGFGAEYFLPATSLFGSSPTIRKRDGLRVAAQWIEARDGDLRRDGWYAQAGYRYSFPRRLLFDRYLRSIEPIVRWSELSTSLAPSPLLPGTWDRRQLLLGGTIEVTGSIFVQVEYTFNDERTGGDGEARSADNDELLVDLIVEF